MRYDLGLLTMLHSVNKAHLDGIRRLPHSIMVSRYLDFLHGQWPSQNWNKSCYAPWREGRKTSTASLSPAWVPWFCYPSSLYVLQCLGPLAFYAAAVTLPLYSFLVYSLVWWVVIKPYNESLFHINNTDKIIWYINWKLKRLLQKYKMKTMYI